MKDTTGWASAGRAMNRAAIRGLRPYRPARPPRRVESLASLLGTIEGEIIPRLLMAHQFGPGAATSEGPATGHPVTEDVREFARIVVSHELEVAGAFVDALLARTVPLEAIYLELFAPTARLLGRQWESDERSFTDVTIGLCTLRQLIREYSHAFVIEGSAAGTGRSILLCPMPGDQHVLGLIMVADFFRRAGWDVSDAGAIAIDEVLALVKTRGFAVIGLSLSCEARIQELATLIGRIRSASGNPAIRVMVGGCPFNHDPDLARIVGADATAADARYAPAQAARLTRPADSRA